MQQQQQIELLGTKVREVLRAGLKLVVLGWSTRWHDEVCRQMEVEKRVVFLDSLPPSGLCARTGYVVYTHRIGHSEVLRIKGKHPIFPVYIHPHQIHEILYSARRLLEHRPPKRKKKKNGRQ